MNSPIDQKKDGFCNFFDKTCKVNSTARFHPPVRLYAGVRISNKVTIGKYSYIHWDTNINSNTTIGNYCSIGKRNEIGAWGHPTDYLSTSPFQYSQKHFTKTPGFLEFSRTNFSQPHSTTIGNDVWIGSHVIIKRGVNIGNGAIIGGGATVVKDVAPYEIVGGVPAKHIRFRFDQSTIEKLLALEWWQLDAHEMNDVSFDDVSQAISQITAKKALLREQSHELLQRQQIFNNKSGSAVGYLWINAPHGHLAPNLFSEGQSLEIVNVNSKNARHNGVCSTLLVGSYIISSAKYDPSKRAYRIAFKDAQGNIYKGAIGKASIAFSVSE